MLLLNRLQLLLYIIYLPLTLLVRYWQRYVHQISGRIRGRYWNVWFRLCLYFKDGNNRLSWGSQSRESLGIELLEMIRLAIVNKGLSFETTLALRVVIILVRQRGRKAFRYLFTKAICTIIWAILDFSFSLESISLLFTSRLSFKFFQERSELIIASGHFCDFISHFIVLLMHFGIQFLLCHAFIERI